MHLKRLLPLFLALIVTIVLCPAGPVMAQDDQENSKDHPLVSRMPNYFIVNYESNFNETDVLLPDDRMQTMEGQLTSITYEIKEEVKHPSELQVVRNYTAALTKMGAEVVFDGEHVEVGGRSATLKLVKDGREVWVVVNAFNNGATYWLRVLEIEAMTQDVEGGSLADTLRQQGRVTVKINFDTGKANIKPDSAVVLDEIVKMLAADPSLKLRIEGHTDNVGKASDNLKLSLARAGSVAEAIIAKGVAAERLAASGFGQAQPVADNANEAGRAENRRVELVRM